MQVVVVFESVHGRTREVAETIAAGFPPATSVRVLDINNADPENVGHPDLIIAGAPDHWSGLSFPEAHMKDIQETQNESTTYRAALPAGTISMREWFTELPATPTLFAAFETRTRRSHFPGLGADKQIQHILERNGFTPVMPAQAFLLGSEGELEPGELLRAKNWGKTLAEKVAARQEPFTSTDGV